MYLNVPFVKTVKDQTNDIVPTSQYQVIPYSGQKMNPTHDEMVYVQHYVCELTIGDFFPPLFRDIRSTYKNYVVTTTEAVDCIGFPM
jgi:hypothetical protein